MPTPNNIKPTEANARIVHLDHTSRHNTDWVKQLSSFFLDDDGFSLEPLLRTEDSEAVPWRCICSRKCRGGIKSGDVSDMEGCRSISIRGDFGEGLRGVFKEDFLMVDLLLCRVGAARQKISAPTALCLAYSVCLCQQQRL